MNPHLKALLEYLSRTPDAQRQIEIEALHRRALGWQPVPRLPVVMSYPLPEDAPFKPYPHSQIFDDPEKMLFNELAHAFNTSIACRERVGDDLPCTIRANFGTVLIASMFGAHVEQFDENPPWAVRRGEGDVSLETILDRNPLDFTQGWCPRVIEMCQFFHETLRAYPQLKPLIKIVLPDLQAPFDNLEIIVGSRVFMDLRSRPELVARALHVLATAQVGFAQHLLPLVTDGPDGFAHQHATMIRGRILLRDDSVLLMSPQMYRDLIAPHDEYVLREMGEGGIHACGNVGQHADAFMGVPLVLCLDFGQSELNDMDAIYRRAQTRKISLIRVAAREEELCSGSILHRFPTGASLIHRAKSLADGRRVMTEYLRAADAFRAA